MESEMNNNIIKTTKTATATDTNKLYKRTNRSVSPETAQKISNSLRTYNATHPRGKASDGSQWSKRISDSLRADTGGYWSKIPKSYDL